MNVSTHFTLHELTFSPTAIKNGINNQPNKTQLAALTLLCEKVLEPVRRYLKQPLRVSSALRVEKLNALIGGASGSQHIKGEAADIQCDGRNAEIYGYLKTLDIDQAIWEFGTDGEPAWVHVSYKSKNNRNQFLKAIRKNGKTIYLPL